MRMEEQTAVQTAALDTLADRMRYLMKALKVKQKDFAKTCGVTENYISLLVTGRRTSISEPMYRLICQVYGVSETWLKTGSGEPFKGKEEEIKKDLQDKISVIMEAMSSAQLQEILNMAERQTGR